MRFGVRQIVILLAVAGCGGARETEPVPPPTVDGWDRPPSIVAGAERTCVTLRDGGVACWGNGWTGRLGDGRSTDSPTPVRVPSLGSIVKLSGAQHTCAMSSDGEMWCWGAYLPTGVVGSESHADFPTPTLQPFVRAIDLYSGDNHVCVLGEGGVMQCRAPVDEGPVALGVVGAQRLVHDGRAVCTIDQARALSCAVRRGGFDEEVSYEPEPRPGIAAHDLAGGVGYRLMALRTDGRVVGREWGDRWTPIEGLAGVARLAGSKYGGHTCVVLADGGVACWGFGDHGQLGDGSFESSERPVRVVGLEDAVAVAAGENHSCAVRRNGRVVCWGANDRGQLGDGSIETSPVPVVVRGLDLTAAVELTVEPPEEGLCLERDTDGDGLGDRLEAREPYGCPLGADFEDDGDGLAFAEDDDSDGDGFADAVEHEGHPCLVVDRDCDRDGVMSFVDRDSDDDGVWDEDEESLEAACTDDADGDGCGDLMEHLLGGCPADAGVVIAGGDRPSAMRRAEVVIEMGGSGSAGRDVTLHVEEVEALREPVRFEVTPVVSAVSSDGGAVPEGEGFAAARPGERLRFEIDVGVRAGYFQGDTATGRAALVLRDEAMTELARGTLLMVVLPNTTCPGP